MGIGLRYHRAQSHGTRRIGSKRGAVTRVYFIRFILICTDTVNDFLGKNCPYVAGGIAFYTLFSMFPLVLATISIWAFFLGPEVEQAELAEQIAEVIPVSTEFVSETMRGVASARAITGIASVFGLMWAASAAFGAIRKGINNAWGVTRARPFLRERLIDLGLVAGAGVTMLLLLFITPMIGTLQQIVEVVFPNVEFEMVARLISQVASPLISFSTFLVLYRYMPNTKVRFKEVWLGALAASLAFDGAKWGFIWYINIFPVYNVVYGSVGAIMALLTWVYVSAIILLFGALATSRYAKFAANLGGEVNGLKLLWMGLARVRLRVVATGEART